MGTLAGLDFTQRLIKRWAEVHTIEKEWDYPHFILDSNPKLPSRTLGILNDDDGYLTHLMGSKVAGLIGMGANEVYVPCNTAHHYLRKSKRAQNHYVDIIKLACKASDTQKMHVLAGEGTRKSKLYDHHSRDGFVTYEESPVLRQVIELVKQGKDISDFAIRDFMRLFRNDSVNVLACTEFSIVVKKMPTYFREYEIIDPLEVAIEKIIKDYE